MAQAVAQVWQVILDPGALPMRKVALVLVAALLAACADDTTAPIPVPASPQPAIVDGSRGGGNPFFLWAPFLHDDLPSDFSADVRPTLTICEWSGTEPGEGDCTPFATFTRSEGTGGVIEVVTAEDPELSRYQLIWRTDLFPDEVEVGKLYRARVRLGSRELGFVDLIGSSNVFRAAFNTWASLLDDDPANDVIGFVVGERFPFIWGIYVGAMCSPLCTPANIGSADVFQGTVDNDVGGTFSAPSGHAKTRIPAGALPFDEVNLVIARVPSPCLPTHLEQAGGCFLIDTEPQIDFFQKDVLVATCINEALPRDFYELYKFDPVHSERGVRPLPPAAQQLEMNCSGFAMIDGPALLQHARAGLEMLVRPLTAAFGPRPLWAFDRGFTHTIEAFEDSYSFFDWAKSVAITATAGDGQVAPVLSLLPRDPAVLVKTSHGDADAANVVAQLPLVFEFTEPDGTTGLAKVSTGDDGSASTDWTLGDRVGLHKLAVRLEPFSGEIAVGTFQNVVTFSRDESRDPELFVQEVAFTATAAKAGTIFLSTFSGDAVDAAPGAPEIGSWALDATGGAITVKQSHGELTEKPVVMEPTGTGALDMVGTVEGIPPTDGVYAVRWNSLVTRPSLSEVVATNVVLRAANNAILATAAYTSPDGLRYNGELTGVTWAPGVAQAFQIIVNLNNNTTSLVIDGVPVSGSQGLPFLGTANDLAKISVSVANDPAVPFAWDVIEVAPADLPDLEIVTLQHFGVFEGNPTFTDLMGYHATVRNSGTAILPLTIIRVEGPPGLSGDDGTSVLALLRQLPPGGSVRLSAPPRGGPRVAGTSTITAIADPNDEVAESDETNNVFTAAPVTVEPRIHFEAIGDGRRVSRLSVPFALTTEFELQGVTFSFISEDDEVGSPPSLCESTPWDPSGPTPNHSATTPAGDDPCSRWLVGTLTMTFDNAPTSVVFRLRRRADAEITAIGVSGNPIAVTRSTAIAYTAANTLQMFEETVSVHSSMGDAVFRVDVTHVGPNPGVFYVDELTQG